MHGAASGLIWLSHSFWVVALSQIATATAGAAIGPSVVGLTLGIVRQRGFNRQNGRNQAFNHAGNMTGAALSGLLGWEFGLMAVFWLAAVFGVLSIVSVATILLAMRMAEKQGYWLVVLISFAALPIRGLIAASLMKSWGVFPVQALDGIGAGLQSVAVPGLVARMMDGTGRVNAAQGAVMTMQGTGASLSPALGGYIAQHFGYRVCFMVLGGFALGSIALWLIFSALVRPACAAPGYGHRASA